MSAQMISIGSRISGAVAHVITRVGDVSACGRMVVPGVGTEKRMCRTCVRINDDARVISDMRRKSAREARIITHDTVILCVCGTSLHDNAEARKGHENNWHSDAMPASYSVPESAKLSWTYELNWFELETTMAKIEKINTRCAKRGIPGGLSVEYTERIIKEKNSLDITVERVVYDTYISGIAPQLPGWEFIGVIDFDRNAGLVVRAYPGATQIDRGLIRDGWCDHCQTERYRKQTMVVRNVVTNEQIQVGSSCIKDFTGWTAMPYSFDTMSKDVEDMCEGFGSGEGWDVLTETVLGVAWACVETWGFVRTNDIGPTVNKVRDVIRPPKPTNRNENYLYELSKVRELSSEMGEKSKALRAWIASDEFSGNSDYVLNLKSIAAAEKVSSKNYGILASAPQAWARFLEKSLIRKAQTLPSNWVGEEKEKLTGLSVKVMSVSYIENYYTGGSTAVIRMMQECGNVFTWFASGKSDWLENYAGKDEYVSIDGTVKKHDEFKGIKSTVLLRVKPAKA